jgi:O-antigen ligase
VWGLWINDYFPAHPWMGRGFGFRSDWANPSIRNPKAVDYRQTVEVQNIHNGLFATLDTFGIVGTIFFVVWNLRILARTFRVSFRRHDVAGMALRFLALYLAVWIISYWVGALTVGTFLPQEFALVSVFFRLQDAMASDSIRSEPAEANVQPGVREELITA